MATLLTKVASRLGRNTLSMAEYESRFEALKAASEAPVLPNMPAATESFFLQQAEKNLFEISRVTDLQSAVSAFHSQLPLALAPQPAIQTLPWQATTYASTDNLVTPALGIIEANWGIAETGTVAIASGEVPSRLLFLAEELLVILHSDRILRVQEELWQRQGFHQRVVHLISGPSRTADVEQTLQVGAHGPRRVYLWLVGATSDSSA